MALPSRATPAGAGRLPPIHGLPSAPVALPVPLDLSASGPPGIDPLLLACTRIRTFAGAQSLTAATGFFFLRAPRLFLVTSRHVFRDAPAGHFPDRITLELHGNRDDLAVAASVELPLYRDQVSLWQQAVDGGGEVDVAALELNPALLPPQALYSAFTPEHIDLGAGSIEAGAPLLVIGFPLGFHDALHHMPVVRRAALASAYGLRFQGLGYFLTDARTHRGTSGAPVVLRVSPGAGGPQGGCRLLGVHSSRFDMPGRDPAEDEALGLNSAWYADVLLTLCEA